MLIRETEVKLYPKLFENKNYLRGYNFFVLKFEKRKTLNEEMFIRKMIKKIFRKAENKTKKIYIEIKINFKNKVAIAKIMAQEVLHCIRRNIFKEINLFIYQRKNFLIFQKDFLGYLRHFRDKLSFGPFLTVDALINYQNKLVLIKRKNPPFGWALPGGFVDYGEKLEKAIIREVKEETGLNFILEGLLGVYSNPKRDNRFHTVSIVFFGKGKGRLKASSDAQKVKIFSFFHLPSQIAFDHRKIISDYLRKILEKI